MSYIDVNKNSYNEVYKKGWGNKYPDSNIVSYYFNYIKPLLQNETGRKPKMLDFGCGLGANTKFFYEQGFEVYGIDISELAIEKCIKNNGFNKDNFKSLNLFEYNTLEEIFGIRFDLVVASETLYYFSKKDVQKILEMFNGALVNNGVIYANWVTYNNDYYRQFKNIKNPNVQVKVDVTGSMDKECNVYIIEDKKEMEDIFSIFNLKYIKSTNIELKGENESVHYIGMKK